jgi:hypothetical protein
LRLVCRDQKLAAVGSADEATGYKVTAAAQRFGFVVPTGLAGVMVRGAQRPADEVPNPVAGPGIYQQNLIRGEDTNSSSRNDRLRASPSTPDALCRVKTL